MPNNIVFSNPGGSVIRWGNGAATPYLTLSGLPSTGTVGVAVSGLVTNPSAATATWTVSSSPADAIVTPSSGTLAPGVAVAFTLTALASGLKNVQLTSTTPNTIISGSPHSFTAASVAPPPPPPAPAASALTLSMASTGTTGSATLVTVTPNAAIGATGTATLSVSGGGTLGTSTLNFTAGSSAAQSTTLTRTTDGTTTLTMTNNMGLSNLGSPASYGSTSAASTGTPQPFTLTSASSGILPFAIGYAMSQGHVPAGQSLSFSGATAKLTVLSTWPDGSARHGIIAGTYTSAGAVTVTPTVATVTAGTALTGVAVQTAMGANTAVFDAGAFGSATFSGADFATPFVTHAATDSFIEAIYRKQIGSDAHLAAWLSLRVWSSGEVEALPWVENGYLNVAGPTNKSATYSFTLGGTSRFSAAIDLPNHCRTPLLSGSALSHWLDTDPAVTAKHDAAYMMATRLVPSYRSTVSPSASIVTSQPSSYTPLQQGGYPTSMGTAGYHESIGVLPEWDALYLTTTASTVWAAIQRQAYSAGRYGIHFRDETTNRTFAFSSYPNLVIGGGNGVSGTGSSTTGSYTPNATGTLPPAYGSTHHPSMGFMAYLITGRFYHLETLQFLATVNYLKNGNSQRVGSDGVFLSTAGANTTRGVGWSIRTLAQAAAVSPDGDAVTAELRNSMAANVAWHHTRYVAQASNPQGWIEPYSDYTAPVNATAEAGSTTTDIVFPSGYVFTTDNYYNGWELVIGGQSRTITAYVGATRTATVSSAFTVTVASQPFELRTDNVFMEAAWMQDFVTAAFGYALAMQPTGTDQTKLREFFHWKARSVVGRLGPIGGVNFLYRDAAQYNIAIAPSNHPDYATGTGPWFANWGELYDATMTIQGSPGAREDGSLRGTSGADPSSASGYWANLMPAISYAVEHGVDGATDAYLRMVWASNWGPLESAFNSVPVWAVRPLVDPITLPAWVPAAGSAANIHANSLAALNPCPANNCWYSQTSKQQAPWRNWNGAAFAHSASLRGKLCFWGGGHGGGEDHSIYTFDFTNGTWERLGPSLLASDYTGTDGYLGLDSTYYDYLHEGSYIVPALHTYGYPTYVPPGIKGAGAKGSWLLPHLVGGPTSGPSPHGVDMETGVWTRWTTSTKPSLGAAPYAGSFYDSTRKKLYWGTTDAATLGVVNMNSEPPRTISTVSVSSFSFGFYYPRHIYVPEADQAIGIGCFYGSRQLRAEVFDLSSGQPVQMGGHTFGTTYLLPLLVNGENPNGSGVDWCPITQAFYLYSGYGSTTVHKLKPSSLNFYTATWTITTETFSSPVWEGGSANTAQGAQPFSRWAYIPSLRCFAWCDGPNVSAANTATGISNSGAMQLWRPAGT